MRNTSTKLYRHKIDVFDDTLETEKNRRGVEFEISRHHTHF
jgi:hypothetical protein